MEQTNRKETNRKEYIDYIKDILGIQIVGNEIKLTKLNKNVYEKIEQILIYLNKINMEMLSALIFLELCKYYKKNTHKISISQFKKWVATQGYLKEYLDYIPLLYPKYPVNKITGLNWTGNSCYLDSVLMCLFAVPNKDIIDNILLKDLDKIREEKNLEIKCSDDIDTDIQYKKNIQKALTDIAISMRGIDDSKLVKTCSNLRQMMSKCPSAEQFHKKDTKDAGEFLQYIFGIFNVSTTSSRITYGSNDVENWDKQDKIIDNKASPIVTIEALVLKEKKDNKIIYDITESINTTIVTELDDENLFKNYKYKKEENSFILESPFIIFYLNRTIGDYVYKNGKFIGTKQTIVYSTIKAPEYFENNNSVFELFGIVIHNKNHYTCTFKEDNNWYYYDDIQSSSVKKIGNYEKMLKIQPNPLTNGNLFFYKKILIS